MGGAEGDWGLQEEEGTCFTRCVCFLLPCGFLSACGPVQQHAFPGAAVSLPEQQQLNVLCRFPTAAEEFPPLILAAAGGDPFLRCLSFSFSDPLLIPTPCLSFPSP